MGESPNVVSDEVQRAMRVRDEFLTLASQELRGPIGLIKRYAQFLLQRKKEESDRAVLSAIIRSADRMEDLVQDMLEISRIRAEGVRLRKQKFDLVQLARKVGQRLQQLSTMHKVRIRAEAPLQVDADPGKTELVLVNLIDNAIRYSPRGGLVDIDVAVRGREAVVKVTDYGLGIPREKQKYVLQPFFQMYPALAGFGGMGLGLYISKQIVEAHKGRIWFESEEGKGSSFYFSLPLD